MLHYEAVPESLRQLLLDLSGRQLMDDFALGGGTSLALRFGHRLSVDLDFFTSKEFSTEELFEGLAIRQATITGKAANSLSIDAGGIKLDFLRHAYPKLAHDERLEDVVLVSLPDLAAMKLNAVANRGAKKDFYDIARLLDEPGYGLAEMIGFFSRKYPATDAFTVIKSLAWFGDAELEPDPISLIGMSWQDVKKKVSGAMAQFP